MHKIYKSVFGINLMKILKRNEAKSKRRDLTALVRQTIKKEGNRYRLEWDKMLDGQLLVGYLTLDRDGNVMSLYTLNGETVEYRDLASFNSVDIMLYEPDHERIAKNLCKNFKNHGYTSRVFYKNKDPVELETQ